MDGASQGAPRVVGCGGLMRDHIRQWHYGFVANIGVGNSLKAKAWDLYRGLNLL